MRVPLVTGGDGYIGSALVKHLGMAVSLDLMPGYQRKKDVYPLWYSSVIHLAACSSVRECEQSPQYAAENNLADVIRFMREIGDLPFIYASSGSVHDTHIHSIYDETKRALDAIIPLLHPNSWGLRFATVCGVSPVMRDDTILNGMTKTAVKNGVIRVRNQHKWRPVLTLDDLCWFVDRCLSGDVPPGIHDVATFNCRIGGYAELVRDATGAVIVGERDTPTYDFTQPTLGRTNDIRPVIEELVAYWKEH